MALSRKNLGNRTRDEKDDLRTAEDARDRRARDSLKTLESETFVRRGHQGRYVKSRRVLDMRHGALVRKTIIPRWTVAMLRATLEGTLF